MCCWMMIMSCERKYMVCAWWSAPTFQHTLSTGGPTVWCPHLPDLSAVDCFVGTWKLYCDSIQQVFGTEMKTAVTTLKDASNTFDMPSAASDLREDILCTWYEIVYYGCAQEAMKTRQHIKFQKGNHKWLRMEAFPGSSSRNIACLCFILVTLTVVLDLGLLNGPHLHTGTRV